MAVVEQLLRTESNGTISFGNHILKDKAKLDDFQHAGDIYKVKTFQTMTKLEKNGMFVYESVPGTSVNHFAENDDEVSFMVEGNKDTQITVGLEDETEYEVWVNGDSCGKMSTNLSGKLSISIELEDAGEISVKIAK